MAPTFLLSQEREALILEHLNQVKISRVHVLNSPYRETNLSITPDGNLMFFMSMRGGKSWSNSYMTFKQDSVFDGDIWYSEKVRGKWTTPKSLPYGINTGDGQDEPNISVDGRYIYYQSWRSSFRLEGGPYYKAERQGNSWSKEVGLGGGITEFFQTHKATDGMAISPDENLFIVAADMFNYDDPMDIYYSRKTKYGWTYCRRLSVSTLGDERSVFLAADGKTLYFASDGYKGYGGLDIFKTTINPDGTVGEVINIGAPFNTAKDDYGFILTADGSEAYFIRNGDIYFANLQNLDNRIKPEKPQVQITLKGMIRDSATLTGLPARVLLLDARTKQLVKRLATSSTGTYQVELPNKNCVYDQIITCEGYPNAKRRLHVKYSYRDAAYNSNFLLAKPIPDPIVQLPSAVSPRYEESKSTREVLPLEEIKDQPSSSLEAEVPTVSVERLEDLIGTKKKEEDPYDFTDVAENNLILLLDVSASMRKPEKLPLLKEALLNMLTHLRPQDLISVMVYSGDAKIIIDGVSAIKREEIVKAIEGLSSGGGTKGKMALRKAYRVVDRHYIPNGNNRIILATDGYFDVPNLYSLASKSSELDVSLSVFSFGKIIQKKEEELSRLAELGNGNYARVMKNNVNQALLKELKAVRKN